MSNVSAQPPAEPAVEGPRLHTALLKVANPVFAAVLRSPLHRFLDATFRPPIQVLTITGRKTGQRYTIVVGRHEINGDPVIFTSMPWRMNARGGADVQVTYHGKTAPARAVLVEDPDEVADAYAAVIGRLGWQAAQRQLGMKINVGRAPTHAELAQAVSHEHLSLIRLQPA
jgi:hypothetical protein